MGEVKDYQIGKTKKFIVIKIADFLKYVKSPFKSAMLVNDLNDIKAGRLADGRNPEPQYAVINTDEPYFPEIQAIMEKHGHWG
jgi:hypothetical protein